MNFRLRFSLINSVDWDNYFVFNSTNSKIEINAGVYEVPVSILNLELPFSNSAASLVQRWVQTCSSSSAISFEDQVFQNTFIRSSVLSNIRSYVRGQLDIALAVLSCLGRRQLNLTVGFICPFVIIDPAYLGATTKLLYQALCLSMTPVRLLQVLCYIHKTTIYVGHNLVSVFVSQAKQQVIQYFFVI